MESAVLSESEKTPGSLSGKSLPPPPNSRRWATLIGLLIIAISAWLVAFALYPAASFSLAKGEAHDLGPLASADLKSAGRWVQGSGKISEKALGFERHGERGSFRLTKLRGREDLWLLLRVPEGLEKGVDGKELYIPPSHFVGRLLPMAHAGLTYAPILALIQGEGDSADGTYLLVDGEMPKSHRDTLLAALVLALVGLACFSLTARLALSARQS